MSKIIFQYADKLDLESYLNWLQSAGYKWDIDAKTKTITIDW